MCLSLCVLASGLFGFPPEVIFRSIESLSLSCDYGLNCIDELM